jgi:hypothetical protein
VNKHEAFATFLVCLAVFGFTLWGVNIASDKVLPPCPTEDSDNCYWDADTMGNGIGRSFTVVDGVVTYR